MKGGEIMLYRMLRKLIAIGKTDGLAEKIDCFFAAGRITEEEYNELLEMLR